MEPRDTQGTDIYVGKTATHTQLNYACICAQLYPTNIKNSSAMIAHKNMHVEPVHLSKKVMNRGQPPLPPQRNQRPKRVPKAKSGRAGKARDLGVDLFEFRRITQAGQW